MFSERFRKAFPVVEVPEEVVVARRPGYIDDFENRECESFFLAKEWTEIDLRDLANRGAFYPRYLTKEAFAYYLPALILATVQHSESDLANTVEHFLEEPSNWVRSTVESLNQEQRSLIREAVRYMLENRYGTMLETDQYFKEKWDRISVLMGITT